MSRRRGHASEGGTTTVELLLTILMSAIIGAAVLTVVVAMFRTETAMQGVRDNMDEARIALDRIRVELRGARRIFEDPDGTHLHFWIDLDGTTHPTNAELIHYELVEAGEHHELVRWTTAAPDVRQIVARSLIFDPDDPPFGYDRPPPTTRVVDVRLVVDAGGDRGAEPKPVEARVRLRNVE